MGAMGNTRSDDAGSGRYVEVANARSASANVAKDCIPGAIAVDGTSRAIKLRLNRSGPK
jgi:hypothetical protein